MAIFTLDGIAPSVPSAFHWVAPTAAVIGHVEIHEDVGIWFGAVLRGDNEPITVGACSNIQEMVTVHTDPGFPVVIGQGCTIGHGAIVHGCTLGDNTLVGMGATILNGARIGANCLIGAGALVTENGVIPANSLVLGSPARVVRELDETAIEGLRLSAERYVANARRFARGLEEIQSIAR